MAGICNHLWDEPQVNWDGKMLGCGRNFWGDFGGNAFRDGLHAAINSEKMRYARDMVRGRQPARDDIPCTTCEIYIGMRARGSWLRRASPLNRPMAHLRGLYRALRAIPARSPTLRHHYRGLRAAVLRRPQPPQ